MVDVDEAEAVAADLFARFVTPDARLDPYPVYRELRNASPLLDSGVGLWLVSGYAEVRATLRHPGLSSDESNSAFNQANPPPPVTERPMHPSDDLDLMLFMDPPDHTRIRKLVARTFTPRRVEAIHPRIATIVDGLLDAAVPGEPFDVIGGLAFPLATQVICELLGVPVADRERFGTWSSDMARAVDPGAIRTAEDNEALGAATEAFVAYFADLVRARRADPGDDLLSALLVVEEEGDRLSHDELLATGLLLLIAGHETTVNLIGNGVAALLADGPALAAFRALGTDTSAAVDELIRIDSPVQLTQRIAVDDTRVGEHLVPGGTSLVLLLGAANRDPAVFDEPDRVRFDRTAVDHVGFGGGIHHCLGAALARAEGDTAITSLIGRCGSIELAAEPVRRTTFTLRGYRELVVYP